METFLQLDHEATQPVPNSTNGYKTYQSPFGNGVLQPNLSVLPTSNELSHQAEQRQQFDMAKQEFDDVIHNSRDVDAHLKQLLSRHQTVIMRLFPGKMQRLINSKERLLVGEAMDFRINLLKLANEFRMEAMRDKYDCFLKAYKGHNRQILTEILMKSMVQLQRNVRIQEEQAFVELNLVYQHAEAFTDPIRRENQLNRARNREVQFMHFVDTLIANFEATVNESLSRYY